MSCSLLSAALIDQRCKSRSWLIWQIPIITEGPHNSARIAELKIKEIDISSHNESSSIETSIIKLHLARAYYRSNNMDLAILEYGDVCSQ